MGEIVKASCKCQRRSMRLGIGMMFYYECDEVMEKARGGRFGRELQEAIEQNFPVVINASREIYWCEKCGHFEANYVLDIYKPKDPVGLIMKQLRGSAEEEKAKFLQNPRYYIQVWILRVAMRMMWSWSINFLIFVQNVIVL